MALIKPRTRGKQMLRHITRLDRENVETLHAYAAFLGEPTEYVINQVIDTVLARDREFVAWRERHPGPFAAESARRSSSKSKRSHAGVPSLVARANADTSPATLDHVGRQATA